MSPQQLFGLVGSPVAQSLSPRLHEAAYEALGLDWAYLAFDVDKGAFPAALGGAAALGFGGLSVTMPHKVAASSLAAKRSRTVRRLGAANTLTFTPSGIEASSTDGEGFMSDLEKGARFDVSSKSCVVIGAGGAARAVVLALSEAGARQVVVVNRSAPSAFRAAAVGRRATRVGRPSEAYEADLVVQATPLGMDGSVDGALRAGVDPRRLSSGQLVVDLVYEPRQTGFLEEAGRAGAATRGGLGMLVWQAALQVELWARTRPPVEALFKAVES